jgi:hypothetical protein
MTSRRRKEGPRCTGDQWTSINPQLIYRLNIDMARLGSSAQNQIIVLSPPNLSTFSSAGMDVSANLTSNSRIELGHPAQHAMLLAETGRPLAAGLVSSLSRPTVSKTAPTFSFIAPAASDTRHHSLCASYAQTRSMEPGRSRWIFKVEGAVNMP